jgi:hypothetical protein
MTLYYYNELMTSFGSIDIIWHFDTYQYHHHLYLILFGFVPTNMNLAESSQTLRFTFIACIQHRVANTSQLAYFEIQIPLRKIFKCRFPDASRFILN